MHVTLITVKKVDAIYNLSSWGFCLSIQTNNCTDLYPC